MKAKSVPLWHRFRNCMRFRNGEKFSDLSALPTVRPFVSPDCFGRGIGSELPAFTVRRHGVTSVDVNEQNLAALKFYRKHGFAVDGRSPLDDQDNPFPILHLKLGR